MGLIPSEWSLAKEALQRRHHEGVGIRLCAGCWWRRGGSTEQPPAGLFRTAALGPGDRWPWAAGKVAAVALARRLAGILYAMLRDNKPFDPTRLGKQQHVSVGRSPETQSRLVREAREE